MGHGVAYYFQLILIYILKGYNNLKLHSRIVEGLSMWFNCMGLGIFQEFRNEILSMWVQEMEILMMVDARRLEVFSFVA